MRLARGVLCLSKSKDASGGVVECVGFLSRTRHKRMKLETAQAPCGSLSEGHDKTLHKILEDCTGFFESQQAIRDEFDRFGQGTGVLLIFCRIDDIFTGRAASKGKNTIPAAEFAAGLVDTAVIPL